MRCPMVKCGDKVEEVRAGKVSKDHLLACVGCSWQVTKRALQAWLDKWRN